MYVACSALLWLHTITVVFVFISFGFSHIDWLFLNLIWAYWLFWFIFSFFFVLFVYLS